MEVTLNVVTLAAALVAAVAVGVLLACILGVAGMCEDRELEP